MSSGQRWSKFWMVAILAVMLIPLLGGCGGSGASTPEEKVAVMKVDAPVRDPIFVRGDRTLLARVEGEPQIAKITPNLDVVGDDAPPYQAETTLSGSFEDAGENVAIDPDRNKEVAYLPQPGLDRIAVIDMKSLQMVDSFKPVPSPERVSTDVGSKTLFALSKDGSTVTGVNLDTDKLIPSGLIEEIPGGANALLEGPDRGIEPHFWASDSEGGVGYYEGHHVPVEKEDSTSVNAKDFAIDEVKDTRVYVAVEGTDHLVAVELDPATRKLDTVAEISLGEPVEYVGVDERRVYAATQNKLYVLKSQSFQSLGGSFETLETIDYRSPLEQEALKNAPLSGMAVSSATSNVYLTLEGEPYVISVHKPTAPIG